jgi:hypothetical protein
LRLEEAARSNIVGAPARRRAFRLRPSETRFIQLSIII